MTQHKAGDRANIAAWLPAKGARLVVKAAPYTAPRPDEIVVETHAVAINPVDWILQISTEFGFSWIGYPFILGSDLAGTVVETGSEVTRFKPGDRVLAHAIGSDRKRNRAAEGSFQKYTVVLATMAAPIPDELSYERAAVIPLGISTAACGLFERDQLALDYPTAHPKRNGKTVLVWGGSTSVGANAIQLAVAAGYDVITTASPKNFAFVKGLGASAAFDYNAPTVVGDLIAAFNGKTIAGALAIGSTSADACVDVVAASRGTKAVSMVSYPIDFAGLSGPPGLGFRLQVIRSFIEFSIKMAVKTRLNGIRSKFVFGSSLAFNGVGRAMYENFLPDALAHGRYVAAPDPHVIGHGFVAIQDGLDVQRMGVSARKIVITLA